MRYHKITHSIMNVGSYAQTRKAKKSAQSDVNNWCSRNPQLAKHVILLKKTANLSDQAFEMKRNRSHNRTITSLVTFITRIEQEILSTRETLEKLCSANIPQIQSLCYDFTYQNMDVRKLFYIEQHLHQMEIETFNLKFSYLFELLSNLNDVQKLLTKPNSIPCDMILSFDDNFYSLSNNQDIINNVKKIRRLFSYKENLSKKIQSYEKPLWHTDIPNFLKKAANMSLSKFDSDISYILPQNCEVSISRFLFHNHSVYGSKVDVILRSFPNISPEVFIYELVKLCYDLVPPNFHYTHQELTIIIIFFFRVLFERVYEKFGSFFYKSEIDERMKYTAILKNKKMSASCFNWPAVYIDSSYSDIKDKISAQDFFKSDQYFSAAAMFLEMTIFCTNPIDALYYCHKTMVGMQKGAIIHSLRGRTANQIDVVQVICFDDLFSLLLGTFLASNLPDLFHLDQFLQLYSPTDTLSPPLEYAKANIEGLAQHIMSMKLD
ncbi:hypothetical protein TRFO_27743 [Tritrichomonas foetus]|uniref:VPS9 domain-containing protein n=1 Tax=Tritrichomonas foetus TaxID=1144522 RepID=A0A1J4K5C4_9EUKA|nr:hypothetical protein TRFO_27743 [Tritrichomonas foetus]|eukprot:OHT04669.1 hypothetical protein TRFO_27743 [Tritrichomonas foetus]